MGRDRFNRSRGDSRDTRDSRGNRNDRYDRRDRDERTAPLPPMKDLVEFIAKGMVDDADAVSVNETVDRNTVYVELRVAQGEVGRVIGREGKLANAMRTLLRAAGNRSRTRVLLDIGD